jgi:hypothetical protein
LEFKKKFETEVNKSNGDLLELIEQEKKSIIQKKGRSEQQLSYEL